MLTHLAGEGIANMCAESRPGDQTAEEGGPGSQGPASPSLSEDRSVAGAALTHGGLSFPFLKYQS